MALIPGLFGKFARRRRLCRLAGLDPAPRQAPHAHQWRLAALDDEDAAIAPDAGAGAKLGIA